MFKANLKDPKLLKHSIDAISNMVDEVGINVTAEGMTLKAMVPAHVALVDYELKKEAFDEYEAGEPLVLVDVRVGAQGGIMPGASLGAARCSGK